MTNRYEPSSDFLKAAIAEDLPFQGSSHGEANLLRLIAFTQDSDPANRDWAVLLLSQEGGDTPEIRAALIRAASDPVDVIRGEAVLGLAGRDPAIALPYVQEALRGESITIPMLEAAAVCAHPSLIADLQDWATPSDQPYADDAAEQALAACLKAADRLLP